ncbi:hypothetical protein [Bacillus testis]|uniref:hypothetical protein n=1 Tax=Bacillus testis TaxID=1622072 RepID=UPI00067F47E7|nr:hypothetical protein [Bacillus testis]
MQEEMLQDGNQTIEPEVEEVTEQPIEQQETQEESQPQDYFTVKYNKEERQVSYDEAPDYIQKGMNYDKVQQKAQEQEQYLNRVARASGFDSHEQMVAALDDWEREQQNARYQEAGIDPDKFQQLVSELPEIKQLRDIQRQQHEQEMFQREVNEFVSEFPDVKPDQIPPEAWTLKEQTGISLLDAYLRSTYKSLSQQKEQEAIQKLQQNQNSSPGALGGAEVNHNSSVAKLSKNDFNSMVDQVLRGERNQL